MLEMWISIAEEQPELGGHITAILHSGYHVAGEVILYDGEPFLNAGSYGQFNLSVVAFWKSTPANATNEAVGRTDLSAEEERRHAGMAQIESFFVTALVDFRDRLSITHWALWPD
ncbi:hypothetical protein C2W62_21825 [Candidatus Entotheonella serta]|nr:hypothetical protein C2W62_21825 [Candidatus Entotheonella serta]